MWSISPTRASDFGVAVHPRAPAFVFPSLGAYVGGDIVAGMLATGLTRDKRLRLFIDVGTNSEIALGCNERVVATAATLPYGHFAWISMVLVLPEYRRGGLGTRLLERCVAALDGEGRVPVLGPLGCRLRRSHRRRRSHCGRSGRGGHGRRAYRLIRFHVRPFHDGVQGCSSGTWSPIPSARPTAG